MSKITTKYSDGCLNIDADTFTFSLIERMYKTGDGVGIQVSGNITLEQESKIMEKCLEVHRLMKELCSEL